MTDAERDFAEVLVQFPCPECKGMIQRTVRYLRQHRALWCELCNRPATYDDTLVQQTEKLLLDEDAWPWIMGK